MSDNSELENVGKAGREYASLAIELLADERGVHAETVIAGVARMAGTFLFRSFGLLVPDAKPGQAVLSEMANESGPRLVEILETILSDAGIDHRLDNVTDDSRKGHEPLLAFLETQKRLEPSFDAVRKQLGLSLSAAADAAALATAILIQQTVEVLDSNTAFDLAVYSFVEGTKTFPTAV